MKNKQPKKSKRLEFTLTEIKRFDKKAKQANSNFKVYAENIIKAIGNDELTLTPNS